MFSLFFAQLIVIQFFTHNILPIAAFELRSFAIESNSSAHCATDTTHLLPHDYRGSFSLSSKFVSYLTHFLSLFCENQKKNCFHETTTRFEPQTSGRHLLQEPIEPLVINPQIMDFKLAREFLQLSIKECFLLLFYQKKRCHRSNLFMIVKASIRYKQKDYVLQSSF